jgi:hypothetical protein
MTSFKVQYYVRICPDELGRTTNKRQYNWSAGRESNRRVDEYETGVLTTEHQLSIRKHITYTSKYNVFFPEVGWIC